MRNKESSHAEWNPIEEGRLLHSLRGRRRVATVSRIAEGSGKDRDSFGFDFRVVAAVISPPWGPLPGPASDKLQSSIIQLLPLHSCHRPHSLIIPVFSLQAEGPISGTNRPARCQWHLSRLRQMLVVTGQQLTRRLRCFLLVWQFVLRMRWPCRRQCRKQAAVHRTQKLLCEEMHLSLRLVFF